MRCENNFNNLQASKCSFLRSTLLALMLSFSNASYGEVILQYFGTSWSEITTRIPELAEAGWSALWLPPPFKAGSIFSVGFDSSPLFIDRDSLTSHIKWCSLCAIFFLK